MLGPFASHRAYESIEIGDSTIQYNPENQDEYLLYTG